MKKADWIPIAVVLAAVGVLLLLLYGPQRSAGAAAVVRIDGSIADTLPLDKDTEKRYECPSGGTNIVTVKNGAVSVSQADCPDRICTRHRPIRLAGEVIVCLPHRLTVTVEAPGYDDGLDAVV